MILKNHKEEKLVISRLGSVQTKPVFSVKAHNEIFSIMLEEDEIKEV